MNLLFVMAFASFAAALAAEDAADRALSTARAEGSIAEVRQRLHAALDGHDSQFVEIPAIGEQPRILLVVLSPLDHVEIAYADDDHITACTRHRFAELLKGRNPDDANALTAIQLAPGPNDGRCDPVAVTRAVNALQRAGEDNAVASMEMSIANAIDGDRSLACTRDRIDEPLCTLHRFACARCVACAREGKRQIVQRVHIVSVQRDGAPIIGDRTVKVVLCCVADTAGVEELWHRRAHGEVGGVLQRRVEGRNRTIHVALSDLNDCETDAERAATALIGLVVQA